MDYRYYCGDGPKLPSKWPRHLSAGFTILGALLGIVGVAWSSFIDRAE
ncbi:MAG: hypothetical protein PVI99_04060 [Anaerolineales bacterium]